MSTLVYVQHRDGTPLMPTKPAKARHLLAAGKAEVVSREPFTIQLTVPSGKRVQPVTAGVDLGAREVGVAAVSNGRVLYQGQVKLRTDVSKRLTRRAQYRRTRRSKKCRYRSPRFDNRSASKRKGRLPPSIKSRVDTTVKVVKRLASKLPVSAIRVEVANFDTQKLRKGHRLQPWDYQRGELYGEENIKMYVRKRDKYTCQYCGVVFPTRLEVDHIIPKSRGGSMTPDNLVASCHECNQRKGSQTAAEYGYPEVQKRALRSLKAAAHTQMGKTTTLKQLNEIAPVEETFGYITKIDRRRLGLKKTHYHDAVAIACAGNPIIGLNWYEQMRAISCGEYRIYQGAHSQTRSHLPAEVFGYRKWDKVKLPDGSIAFVGSRRASGQFSLRDIEGDYICKRTHKKLELIERSGTLPSQIVAVSRKDGDGL